MSLQIAVSRNNRQQLGLTLSAWLIALVVFVPLAVVLQALFTPADDAWLHLREHLLAEYMTNTAQLIMLTVALATLMGVGTAWLTTFYRFPGDRWLSPALILPLAIPTYVAGYLYGDLLEISGPVQTSIRDWVNLSIQDWRLPPIRSLPGAAIVMSLVLYPYVYVLARANFESQSSTLNRVAQSLGVSGFSLARRVTLPLARPAIAGGAALVMMETAAEFGLVEYFGVPTLTTGVFRTWLAMGEHATALKLAGYLFTLVVLLVVFEQLSRRGQQYNLPAPSRQADKKKLKGFRSGMALTACLLPVALGFILPVGLLTYYTFDIGDPLFGHRFFGYVSNTVTVAVVASLTCVGGALVLSYAVRDSRSRAAWLGARVATLGYAVPGLVLATGALIPLAALDRLLANQFDAVNTLLLTGSIGGLVVVYTARFMTVSYNNIQSGMGQIHPAYDAAARSMGAKPGSVLYRVHLPLLKGTLGYAWLLVLIDVIKELPATLILRPFNFETLATRVYRLASDERVAEASTAALLIVLISLIPTLLLARRQPH